jgi:hypothetical protein
MSDNEDQTPKRCHFCGESFRLEKGTRPEDEYYAEEVGEWWSTSKQESFLGHPDCLPMGADATLTGQDPEWSMA